ncbi:MAG: VPS10 domain-containing protein [Longimicrobiales bacterium]
MLRLVRSHPVGLVIFLVLGSPLASPVFAQQAQEQAEEAMIHAPDHPLLRAFRWRSIGPAGQGGRVDDIAVRPDHPQTFFVGFATGGLWKTTNNGTTFEPVFDTYGTHSIGDIAIAPSDPDVLYVGTGEPNNRQSSSFGDGIYRSEDGGETFEHIGLRETQTIARVLVHPENAGVVWVAANGPLFAANAERGVFKSTDGGSTWRKVLFVDEKTGATDLVLHPANPDILYAATYQRRRTPCCFVGGGPGSGLWRSDDGGETWNRLEGGGLPRGTMGRIGLAVTAAQPDMLYAQIEVAANMEESLSEEEQEEWERLADADSLAPDPEFSGVWRSDDRGENWDFRSNENGRPMYFSQIRVSDQDPDIVFVVDQQVHRSRDGGETFEELDGYGHVDQHAFWIDPSNDDHLMIGNDGSLDMSWDQGETWESHRTWAVGQPYHASVDMRRPYYVCTGLQDNGSWCGPSTIRESGILAEDWFGVAGGDGFYTAVDPTDPMILFAESQNGNMRRVNLREGESDDIQPEPPDSAGADTNIVPAPDTALDIRWNWNTPFMLSPHNPQTLYAGGNHLFTSRDRGETWTMSPDLTRNIDRDAEIVVDLPNDLPRCDQEVRGEECILSRNDGVSNYSTITTIAESSIVPGTLWVGTDDGNIQVSRDGGATWTEVGRTLPGGTTRRHISRVEASHHDPAAAFVSIDAHRSGDLRPYVYVTRDYGQTWTAITSNLPEYGNVNTIRQDPKNADLLYAGTEFGFFVSLDAGGTWQRFMPNLPVVRIDDVLVHPRENDLVLATHGRSIWIMDDVSALQTMTDSIMAAGVHLFAPRAAVLWKEDIRLDREAPGDQNWTGENAPAGTSIQYHLAAVAENPVTIRITDVAKDEVVRHLEGTGHAGLNRVQWDLLTDPEEESDDEDDDEGPPVEPGTYRITIAVDGVERSSLVTVLEDVWMMGPR